MNRFKTMDKIPPIPTTLSSNPAKLKFRTKKELVETVKNYTLHYRQRPFAL